MLLSRHTGKKHGPTKLFLSPICSNVYLLRLIWGTLYIPLPPLGIHRTGNHFERGIEESSSQYFRGVKLQPM